MISLVIHSSLSFIYNDGIVDGSAIDLLIFSGRYDNDIMMGMDHDASYAFPLSDIQPLPGDECGLWTNYIFWSYVKDTSGLFY